MFEWFALRQYMCGTFAFGGWSYVIFHEIIITMIVSQVHQ